MLINMGRDFSYRMNNDKDDYSLNDVSRHNYFLGDLVIEDTRFSYDEVFEEITLMLQKFKVGDAVDKNQIAEALRIFITIYSEMDPDDIVFMTYC